MIPPGAAAAASGSTRGDDPLGAHQPGREHAQEADRAVADDRDGRARLDVRRNGGEPTSAHDVGERQEARDQARRGKIRGGDEGAVRERNA